MAAVRRGGAEQAEVEVRLVVRVVLLERLEGAERARGIGPEQLDEELGEPLASASAISVPPGGIHTAVAVSPSARRTHG